MDKEIIQTPIALIIKHFLLLTISCLIAAGYENKTAQGKYHPTRFTIKSQGHGTILKGMYMFFPSERNGYFSIFSNINHNII